MFSMVSYQAQAEMAGLESPQNGLKSEETEEFKVDGAAAQAEFYPERSYA